MVDYKKVEETLEEIREELREKIKKVEGKVIETKNYLKKEFENRLRDIGIDGDVFVGGSVEKGTWLPDKIEFDIFIRIKRREDFEKFYEICPEGERVMGSRDYFRFFYKGWEVEVVPIKYIERPEDAENITDLSPFHVDYVKSRTDEEMRMDIRLLKMFLKRKGIYGAETYISGFSGYMTELLIIRYGSITKLFKEVEESWKGRVYIDIEHYYRSLKDAFFHLGHDKTLSPIILVDPTFKYRNAAAALSKESYFKFIFFVRKFLRNPTKEEFLREEKPSLKDIKMTSKKRGTKLIVFSTDIPKKKDIFLGKVKRISRRIKERLESMGWNVYSYGFFEENNKVYMYFELETIKKSKSKKQYGPPVWIKGKDFDKFIEKHREVYVDGENIVADVKRKDIDKEIEEMVNEYKVKFKRVV